MHSQGFKHITKESTTTLSLLDFGKTSKDTIMDVLLFSVNIFSNWRRIFGSMYPPSVEAFMGYVINTANFLPCTLSLTPANINRFLLDDSAVQLLGREGAWECVHEWDLWQAVTINATITEFMKMDTCNTTNRATRAFFGMDGNYVQQPSIATRDFTHFLMSGAISPKSVSSTKRQRQTSSPTDMRGDADEIALTRVKKGRIPWHPEPEIMEGDIW